MNEEQEEDEEERIAKRDRRFNIEIGAIVVIVIALNFLPGNMSTWHHHHAFSPQEAKDHTLALAFVGIALLYCGLFAPVGWVERMNERSTRPSNNLPEWGWFGRIAVIAVGAFLTWWQGGEVLAYMGF